MFILAQISGFLAWLALLFSYYKKNTNSILAFHIISIIFYLLNYLFLGAWSGLFIIIIELLRDFLYFKTDKDNLIFLLSIPVHILFFIIYRNNLIEMIPIIASLIEGFTLTKKKNVVIPGAVIVYSLWVIYDINIKAYTGAFTSALIVFSNLYIYLNTLRGLEEAKKFKISSRFSITKDFLKKMNTIKKNTDKNNLLLSNSYEEKLLKKNENNFMLIKLKKELKGYITKILVPKETIKKILKLEEINKEYENIIIDGNKYGKSVIIDSIVLKEKHQNIKSINLITKNIKKLIKNINYDNIIIIATTDFEKEIANNLKFKIIKNLKDNSIIYSFKDI